MHTKVQKWGNSLAVRIPRSIALEAGLAEDSEVALDSVDGGFVVRKLPIVPTLEELLANVTEENRHGEWDTGAPVGAEVW
jgi:antitoxin MazE